MKHASDWSYRELPAGWIIITEMDNHAHIVIYWSVRNREGVWLPHQRLDRTWSGIDL